MKEIIHFNRKDYNKNGYHKTKSKYLFGDFITDCEKKFYEKYKPIAANHLFANNSNMLLL
jgi:hypothetical protein